MMMRAAMKINWIRQDREIYRQEVQITDSIFSCISYLNTKYFMHEKCLFTSHLSTSIHRLSFVILLRGFCFYVCLVCGLWLKSSNANKFHENVINYLKTAQ